MCSWYKIAKSVQKFGRNLENFASEKFLERDVISRNRYDRFWNVTSFARIAKFVPPPLLSCAPDTKSQNRSKSLVETSKISPPRNSWNVTSFPGIATIVFVMWRHFQESPNSCHLLCCHVLLIQNRKIGPKVWSKPRNFRLREIPGTWRHFQESLRSFLECDVISKNRQIRATSSACHVLLIQNRKIGSKFLEYDVHFLWSRILGIFRIFHEFLELIWSWSRQLFEFRVSELCFNVPPRYFPLKDWVGSF
jgi:hypothetical protein